MPGLRTFPANPGISIRITTSSSSYSLTEPKHSPEDNLKPCTEMRRCASTSRLVSVSGSTDEADDDVVEISRKIPPCTLQLMDDGSKAYSAETLSVTYKIGSGPAGRYESTPVTPGNDDDSEKIIGEDDTLSHDGIVINITPGCGSSVNSLSSNDAATNPEIDDFEDDISGYKEQQMDEFLQLPQDDAKDLPSDDEDSLTDCGLQFKVIPQTADEDHDEERNGTDDEDYGFVTTFLDSELPCPEADSDCKADEVRVLIAYHESVPPDTSVRLQVSPDATAREIVEASVGQVNEAALDGRQDSEVYRSDQDIGRLCLVVSFDETERYLSDSFQPLKVQNPWTKGRLLVKQKAEECSSDCKEE